MFKNWLLKVEGAVRPKSQADRRRITQRAMEQALKESRGSLRKDEYLHFMGSV